MGHPEEQPPTQYRGRRRSVEDEEDDELELDQLPPFEDETPTGRHSRVELERMLAEADARDAEQEPAKPSRAGRNLPAATGVGLGLVAAVAASLAWRREAFLAIVLAAVLYATYELFLAMKHGGISLPLVPLLVGGAAMDLAAWQRGGDGLVVGLLLTVIAIAVWRTADGDSPRGSYARDAGAAVLVAMYVPFLAGFAVLLAHPGDGAGRVLALIVTVVCSDVGGYAVGVVAGRHPMAPLVSPKKSWEGFAGSAIACGTAGALLFALLFHQQWWQGALYGLAIVASATVGDLGESMLKRDLGIKDMGRLLPGHGGLMDRLDSLLPSAAVAYLFLSALVP